MMITKDNLYDVTYENENTRLLITDVVNGSNMNVFYKNDTEITLAMALNIWYQVNDERKRKSIYRSLPKSRRRFKLFLNSMFECT